MNYKEHLKEEMKNPEFKKHLKKKSDCLN